MQTKQSITGCQFTVQVQAADGSTTADLGVARAYLSPGAPDTLGVQTYQIGGGLTDEPFQVAVHC